MKYGFKDLLLFYGYHWLLWNISGLKCSNANVDRHITEFSL